MHDSIITFDFCDSSCPSCLQALYDAIFGATADGGENIRTGLLQLKERLAANTFSQLLGRVFRGREGQGPEAEWDECHVESGEEQGIKEGMIDSDGGNSDNERRMRGKPH